MIEYIKNLAVVMMMVSIANILIPEGGIKKFASLAMGFIMISSAIFPLGDLLKKDFADTFVIDEKQYEKAEKETREKVLSAHKENLEMKIMEHIKHNSDVNVSVDDDANITDVKINAGGDESSAVAYIINTLKVPRERIKIVYDKN